MLEQFGSSLGEWLCIPPAKLVHQSVLPFSSTSGVPGRRTLISEFSILGKVTGEVKHITPGWDKGWIDKHKGTVTPFRFLLFPQILMGTMGVDHRVYGWDVISSVRRS